VKLRGIFFHDLGRKGLALGLGLVLWFWADNRVTQKQGHSFKIVTGDEVTAPENNTIQVQVPPGWILVAPKPGSNIQVLFEGPRSTLENFFKSQCAASYRAEFSAEQEVSIFQVPLRPRDLSWQRPQDAQVLLGSVPPKEQPLEELRFERRRVVPVDLTSEMVRIQGDPAESFAVESAKIRFTPSRVEIDGPTTEVDQLRRRLKAMVEGTEPEAVFLDLVNVDGARRDLTSSVALDPSLLQTGIRMEPERVLVSLPLRLKEPVRVEFFPEDDGLLYLFGKAPGGSTWTPKPLRRKPWVAQLLSDEGLPETFDRQWVTSHVRLLADLSQVKVEAKEYPLKIEWTLFGLEKGVRDLYLKQMTITPEGEEDWTVTVVQNPQ